MRYAILFLLLAAVGFGADLYVSADVTPGTGTGTMVDPYGRITDALIAAGNGDTIHLVAGAYPVQFTGDQLGTNGYIMINSSVISTGVTIQGGGSEPNQVTIKAGHATYGLRFATSNNDATMATVRNLTLSNAVSAGLIYFDSDAGNKFTAEECDIVTTNGKPIVFANADSAAVQTRDMRFVACTITSDSNGPFDLTDYHVLVIDDCTCTFTNSMAGGRVIYLRGKHTHTILTDNTVTCKNSFISHGVTASEAFYGLIKGNNITFDADNLATIGIRIEKDQYTVRDWIIESNIIRFIGSDIAPTAIRLGPGDPWTATREVYGIRVINNVIEFTMSGNSRVGTGIINGAKCQGTHIAGNRIIGARHGIIGYGAYGVYVSNYIYGGDGINLFGSYGHSVINNTVISHNHPGFNARALMFARVDLCVEQQTSDFDATTVTATGWDLSPITDTEIASGRVLCTANNVSGQTLYTHYGVVTDVDDAADSVTVAQWIKAADGTTETPTGSLYVNVIRYSTAGTVYNNSLDAAASNFCMTFDFNPTNSGNYINYNNYVAGIAALSNKGYVNQSSPLDGTQSDLADMLEVWAQESWTMAFADNDSASLSVTPTYDVNGRIISTTFKDQGLPILLKADGTVSLHGDIGGTKFIPTLPTAANVRDGEVFGYNDETEGTLDLPAESNVKKGVTYDGEGKTGTLRPVDESGLIDIKGLTGEW